MVIPLLDNVTKTEFRQRMTIQGIKKDDGIVNHGKIVLWNQLCSTL